MTSVQWLHGETVQRCPLCGDDTAKEQVARLAVAGSGDTVTVSRCVNCQSMVVSGHLLDDVTPDDDAIDQYVQQTAGIETIFDRLTTFEGSGVARFADVGCNFGFGADIASRLFGWEAEGFDPSPAAARGHRDLTPLIRREVLDATTEVPGGPFDLMLASEVIEHVDDPVAFLTGVLPHLRHDGVLVITTPSADAVRPTASLASVVTAVSPGHHRFLASARALTTLLRSVGLHEIDLRDDGETIVVVASRGRSELVGSRRGDAPLTPVVKYFDVLAEADDVSTLVRVSAAARHFKQLVLRGDLDNVAPSRQRLVRQMHDHFGIDLDDLASIARRCADRQPLPWFIVGTLFADGMAALQRGDVDDGTAMFALAVEVWQRFDKDTNGSLDLETAHLGLMSAAHRLLSLARSAPAEVPAAAAQLDALAVGCSPSERSEVLRLTAGSFSGLVSVGAYLPAERMLSRVELHLDDLLGGEPSARRTGLDALFCRAMLALQLGQPALARSTFMRCCEETAHDDTPHAATLLAESLRHVDISVEHVRTQAARGGIVQSLDLYWADARGVYVEGFAFAPGSPADEIVLRIGETVCAVVPTDHAGATAMYPDDVAAATSGFTAHLIGPLSATLTIELTTAHGRRTIDVALPSHPLPDWPTDANPDAVRKSLSETLLRYAPPGPAIALGVRGHDASALETWRELLDQRQVSGVDVHPGPGVDIVGDAHCLSSFIAPGSIAIFMSDAVFEHLEAPWLVAAEVHRILMIGGVVAVSVPAAWPEHAAPNDFWRMSPDGLRSLFGPRLGFTVIASGGFGAVSVVPGPRIRELHSSMPVLYGPSTSYVVARKDVELSSEAVRWPYDRIAGLERAKQYPLDGVETGLR